MEHPPTILTVDVEDYFQVSAFENRVARDSWGSMPSRVQANTEKLLDLFEESNAKATFFVLGWVASRFPRLVQRIADSGHELASHGYWHRLVYQQTPKAFRQDIHDSRNAIADACGALVTAYRAPSFSITKKSEWALEILVEEGFCIDSSIFPMHHDRYGMPDSSPKIHSRETNSGVILEIPPTVWQKGPIKVPVGGGYFRLFPLWLTEKAIRGVRSEDHPAMIYLHPWEVDPEQPRITNANAMSRFRHYVGLSRTTNRLRSLLGRQKFVPISEALHLLSQTSEPLSQQLIALGIPPSSELRASEHHAQRSKDLQPNQETLS